ncbi:MAG: hypothetical protein WC236_08620 [Gallionellaceae bacterium]|jgi:hypothetical protein
MKTYIATLALLLLSACQSTHRLEKDTRYVKLATVIDKYEFSENERNLAQASNPDNSNTDLGVGKSGFGGIMLGLGDHRDNSDIQPQISDGAIRYILQPLNSQQRIAVLSYSKYKILDCVKVLAGHPTEFPRFFKLKSGEHCN